MALYAIGDLHLHFQTEMKVKTQMKDRIWKKLELKFQKNCFEMIQQEDTLVLVGDHSFGRNLKECETDIKPSDSYAIASIMERLEDWERSKDRVSLPMYGRQRIYIRKV